MDTECIQPVYTDKNSIDKNRLDKISKERRFSPPTIEEVKAYCEERKNGVDPQAFVDFYTAKGWKVGKDPMKDWQAAVRTWERREPDKKKGAISHDRQIDRGQLERIKEMFGIEE